MTLDSHPKSQCKQLGQKVNAFVRSYFTLDQKFLLINSVVKSQFNYSPLVWMFSFAFFKELPESYLRVNHNDHVQSFQDILRITIVNTIYLKKH